MISPRPADERLESHASSPEAARRAETAEENASPPPHPLEPLLRHWNQLLEEIGRYLALRLDDLKRQFRTLALYAVLGLAAGAVGLTCLVVAVVLLLQGCADGLAIFFGDRAWAGELVVGAGVLLAAAVAMFVGSKSIIRQSRQRTIDKYEHRRNGRDGAPGAG